MSDKFMSAKRQKLLFSKVDSASLTAWSLMYSGKNIVIKIGSFPFPRGPDRCFWELRIISLSPKRLMALFDSKIKMNFEEEILYRVLIFVAPSVSREYEKTFDSRNDFGSTSEQSKCSSRDFPFIWAAFFSTRALCHTSLVAQNFLKESNLNMSPKEGQLIDYNTRLLVVEIMLISSVHILTAKEFGESLVVTTLWLLSFNPGVSVTELWCFISFWWRSLWCCCVIFCLLFHYHWCC